MHVSSSLLLQYISGAILFDEIDEYYTKVWTGTNPNNMHAANFRRLGKS